MAVAHWDQISTLLAQYWSVPIGMTIVYFFARYHFNTPDYVLINDVPPDGAASIEPKNSSAARLRTTAPPVFTTLRKRYIKAEVKYIVGLEITFLCITIFPVILTFIPNLQGAADFVSKSLEQRVIIAALVLTGFLSSFPFIRDFDGWLLKALHSQASIPDDAEQTADELFDVGYLADPVIMKKICAGITRSPHLRAVADGTMSGALETDWLNLRCLTDCLKDVLQEGRYRAFKRRFRFEFEDIYTTVQRLRADVIKLLETQAAVVPIEAINIDDWIDQNASVNPSIRNLSDQRAKLLFDIDAIRYRICLFTSVLVYATEPNLQSLNKTLARFGFPVEIIIPPTRTGDLVLFNIFGTFVACLIVSFLYTLVVQAFGIPIPTGYHGDVPATLKEAGFWSLTTAFIHGTACLVASILTVSKLKAQRAQGVAIVSENPFVYTSLIAMTSCIIPTMIMGLFSILTNINILDILPWTVLPFITAFFASYYINIAASGKNVNEMLPKLQSGIMVISTLLIAITLNTQGPLPQWPTIFWVFLLYAALTTGLIGLILGEVFRRGLKVTSPSAGTVRVSASGLSFVPQA